MKITVIQARTQFNKISAINGLDEGFVVPNYEKKMIYLCSI